MKVKSMYAPETVNSCRNGTAISIVVMLAAVLVVAGTRFSPLAGAGAIGIGLIGAAIWLEPYRRERILSFLDPWQDPQGAGFQSVQAMLALGSGGFFGVGLGESVQKVLSRGSSRCNCSATLLMRKFPSETPRRPGWQLLIE